MPMNNTLLGGGRTGEERERERERESERLGERALLGIRRRKKDESKQAMNRDDVDVTVQRR